MCASSLQTPRLRLISLKPRLRPGYIKRQSGMICCNTSASTICFNSHASPAPATRPCDHARNIKAAPKADRSMYLICSFIKYIFWFCSCFFINRREQTKNDQHIHAGRGCFGTRFARSLCDHSNYAITGLLQSPRGRSATSVVAVDALHAFVLFLRMQAE